MTEFGLFILGTIVGLLVAAFVSQTVIEDKLSAEYTVEEVTTKLRQVDTHTSEIYYTLKLCSDEDKCYKLDSDKYYPLKMKFKLLNN